MRGRPWSWLEWRAVDGATGRRRRGAVGGALLPRRALSAGQSDSHLRLGTYG